MEFTAGDRRIRRLAADTAEATVQRGIGDRRAPGIIARMRRPSLSDPAPRARRLGPVIDAVLAGSLVGAALALPLVVSAQTPSSAAWPAPSSAPPQGSPATASPAVRLHRQPAAGRVGIVAENTLAGPVEVLLTADGATPGSDPPLPARATVPAHGRTLVAWLPDAADGAVDLTLRAVPGHPSARPRDVEYAYPLRGAPLRIAQGFGGGFSHHDPEHAYAVDFAVDAGTPVLAARDGTVMQVEAGISGSTRLVAAHDDPARANFVRVLHDDGTMALYAHLQRGGVIVAPDEHVRRGQILGFSGNTGASTGPHLHFAVQANRGLRLESLPFRMFGPGGVLRFAQPAPD